MHKNTHGKTQSQDKYLDGETSLQDTYRTVRHLYKTYTGEWDTTTSHIQDSETLLQDTAQTPSTACITEARHQSQNAEQTPRTMQGGETPSQHAAQAQGTAAITQHCCNMEKVTVIFILF